MTAYILDTNVFLTAAESYYAFDIAPGFWEALALGARTGRVSSIDRVLEEIQRKEDAVAEWVRSVFVDAFASTLQADVVAAYGEVVRWVESQAQYRDYARAGFASGADGWLIAYARAKDCTIVTLERLDPLSRSRVPIPNVCRQFGVPYISTFPMLRNLKVRFGLVNAG